MSDLAELERRITAALQRIDKGIEGLPAPAAAAAPAPVPAAAPVAAPAAEPVAAPADAGAAAADLAARDAEIAQLRAALQAEKALTGQLQDRLRAIRDKDTVVTGGAEARLEKMTRQLDVQGLELQRMRKTAVSLREQLRAMRHAQAAGVTEPHLINKAMLAELEALRATRLTEMAEVDDIIAELTPLITEAENA